MGPNLDFARQQDTKAFEEVKKLLEEKHRIPKKFYLGSCPKEARREYARMRKTIEAIFILEACENW